MLQYGRSMIEMLGVLAIIGVLSVGGIAGYSKAMTKFKINKTIDQISQISANVRTLYASQENYEGLNDTVVQKAKLAPDDVFIDGGSGSYMINPFGGSMDIGKLRYEGDPSGDSYVNYFQIRYDSIPEDACIELLTQDWGQSTQGLVGVTLGSLSHAFECGAGYDCDQGSNSFPVSVSKAASLCSGNSNSLKFVFE